MAIAYLRMNWCNKAQVRKRNTYSATRSKSVHHEASPVTLYAMSSATIASECTHHSFWLHSCMQQTRTQRKKRNKRKKVKRNRDTI
jgi:hypothetical protein